MEIIALPRILPGDLDLTALNARLRASAAQLDWSAVEDAPPDALRALLAGLDLGTRLAEIGVETVPDALAEHVLLALDGARAPIQKQPIFGVPLRVSRPMLWPQPVTQRTFDDIAGEDNANANGAEDDEDAVYAGDGAYVGDADSEAVDEAEETEDTNPRLALIDRADGHAVAASEASAGGEQRVEAPRPPLLQAPQPAVLRAELEQMVLADLLGPAGGEEEEIARGSVRDRYLVGQLAPLRRQTTPEEQDDLAVAGSETPEEGPLDAGSTQTTTLFPSSIGLTFCVDGAATALRIEARWGQYARVASETLLNEKSGSPKMVWKRRQMGGVLSPVLLREGELDLYAPDPEQPLVVVRGVVRRRGADWIVTLFLVNAQQEPKQLRDSTWLFQAELSVESADGAPMFCHHVHHAPLGALATSDEATWDEAEGMAMLYREHVEFAVGHGVGVHAETTPGAPDRARRIVTRAIPSYDVPQTTAPTLDEIPELGTVVLGMRALAETPDLSVALLPLADAYASWIAEQAVRAQQPDSGLALHQKAARRALTECRTAQRRIRAGIALLASDRQAAEAFRFMNAAMARQRVHTRYLESVRRRQSVDLEALDIPRNRSWRPFQLAFILLNLPGVTDLRHPDRSETTDAVADLLWFPTGGGKTEAYLGLTAYTLALRRLQGMVAGRSGMDGVGVLMRYTLRLLTLQQFQRAATLMCACETVRREAEARGDQRWGMTPFRVGLWVGQRTTPNRTEQSAEAIKLDHGLDRGGGQFRRGAAAGGNGTPAQLTACPWCGAKIDPGKHIKVESFAQGAGRTYLYCGDPLGLCPFSERQAPGDGLPVVVVDEEIYRLLPALLIATVDKFAQMPWNGAVEMLFGQVNGRCERHGFRSPELDDSDSHPRRGMLPAAATRPCGPLRPPDLIIQDELHLISGPLGTLVGLYEAAIDHLASWEVEGVRVRPKVIASTATIRRAAQQVRALYTRQVQVFPPHGLDLQDTFFARQRTPDDAFPGRRYLGICAPGRRIKQTLIRVYVAQMAAAQALYERYGAAVDPWMTLVGYFNAMRELAGMLRLVNDDIRARLATTDARGLAKRQPPLVAELTSRKSATEIPYILDQMETAFNPADDVRRAEARRANRRIDQLRPLDVLLATNMISVGVDVRRLGMMVVGGQPKTTAEYIQATSRVGREYPGLVITVFNWARPRDLSHYEQFEHYHATFYQHVEALSVTPFAPRALDRGLSGVLVGIVRLLGIDLNANERAGAISREHPFTRQAIEILARRAVEVTGRPELEASIRQELAERLDTWVAEATRTAGGRTLGYRDARDGRTVGLLRSPSVHGWTTFTCLNSLRDVEPTINLILDDHGIDGGAPPARVAVSTPTTRGDAE